MLDPLYFSVTFSVEINTTDVTYGWNGDTVGYRVYYQHFSTEQDQMKNVRSKVTSQKFGWFIWLKTLKPTFSHFSERLKSFIQYH